MSNAKTPKNEETLAIRMTKQLLNQLNALAQVKQMGTATMARMALADYLTREAPNALLNPTTPQQPQQKVKGSASYQAMSPSERQAWDKEWDY